MNLTKHDVHACINGLIKEMQKGRTAYPLLVLLAVSIFTTSIAFWLNIKQDYNCPFFKRIMTSLFLCIFGSTMNCLLADIVLLHTNISDINSKNMSKYFKAAWILIYFGANYKSLISWHILVVAINRWFALYFPWLGRDCRLSRYTFWFLVLLWICHALMSVYLSVIDLIQKMNCYFITKIDVYILFQNVIISSLVLFLHVVIIIKLIAKSKLRRRMISSKRVSTESRTIIFCVVLGVSFTLANGPVSLQVLLKDRTSVSAIFLSISVYFVDPLLFITKVALEKKLFRTTKWLQWYDFYNWLEYIYITDSIGCSFKIKIAYLASDFLVFCREGLCKGTRRYKIFVRTIQ